MWLRRRYRHPPHDEPDSVTFFRGHHENLPVEVEEHIEGQATRLYHAL